MVTMALLAAACGNGEDDATENTATDSTPTERSDTVAAVETATTAETTAEATTTETTVEAPTTTGVSTTETTEAPVSPSPLEGLTVRVDQVVKFETGGTSASIEGAVIRGERDVYRLEAAAGQQLDVTITSVEDNGVFDVFDPAGNRIADEQFQAAVPLPATGEYLVVVGGIRGNVSYTLTVSIPA